MGWCRSEECRIDPCLAGSVEARAKRGRFASPYSLEINAKVSSV